MQRLKLFRSLQDSNVSITLGSRRSPVREELRGVVVDGAGDAPPLDAVLVVAVPCPNGGEKTTLNSKIGTVSRVKSRVSERNSERVAWVRLLTAVAVGAEAVGGVDVVERRRPGVPELDVVGPGAEAAQVAAGVRGQQVPHRRRRRAAQAALGSKHSQRQVSQECRTSCGMEGFAG